MQLRTGTGPGPLIEAHSLPGGASAPELADPLSPGYRGAATWVGGAERAAPGRRRRQTGPVSVTVLQLSDTHLVAEPGGPVHGLDPDARLDDVLAAWAASDEAADLILLTGDLTDDGSVTACERLAAALGRLDAPVLATAGNHDRPDAVSAVFGSHHVAELDGWRVVAFDTSVPGEIHGAIDVPAALGALDALDARPTVVALHHPPLSRSSHPWFQLHGAEQLLAGLGDRPHVRGVVAGHLHDAVELSSASGVPVLGCPSTLYAITHRGDEMELGSDAPRGARIIELGDDGEMTSRLLVP